MPEIKITINKEGAITINASHQGNSCENSPFLKKITSILQTEGEIDEIKLKYNPDKIKQKSLQTIKIENLI